MDVVRADGASTSGLGCAYHVFLSFRGTDTRKTFIDHLYTALVNGGFRTFRDDDEIQRGEKVKSELHRAIKQSRVSIIVFSKDYASSTWCLDELVTILDHKTTSDHLVLPVFYDVDPSEVRKQMGSVADAFARHEGDERSHRWRTALRDAADLAGMCLRNQADGHESKFIQKIIKVIQDKLRRSTLSVDPYLVGMHSRAENIDLWLKDGSTDVGITVICGTGGIGKTTIAKFVYNSNFENFEASAFLPNIREISKQPNGLVCLQRQLLSKILNREHEKLWSVDEGIIRIKDAISCRRILLVLDDVDQEEQLDAIIGMRKWFCSGSKIIITSRHERLLKGDEVYEVYKVRKLNDEESLNLFSWHSFGKDYPVEAYMEHSKKGTKTVEGLALDTCMFKEHGSTQTSFNNSNAKKRRPREHRSESKEGNPQKRHRFSFFSWHLVNTNWGNSKVVVETDAFAMMHKLRILKLKSVQLTGSYKGFPKRLRWLCWQGFPSSFIPTDFPMECLVALEMPYSNLKQVWRETKFLASLKFLDLSHSRSLVKTPDFSEIPNLERVILEDCRSLVEVHDSIGMLKRLVLLNLKDCKNLRELPRNIGLVKVMETLVISGCSNLKGLPMDLRNMESLKVFGADGIDVHGLLSAIEEVRPWHTFLWTYVSKPRRSPKASWDSLPHSLVSLSLAGCNLSSDDFPGDFSSLSLLKSLNLSRNPIRCLPDCLRGLSTLEYLSFRYCRKLQSIMGLPHVKKALDTWGCKSLQRITYLSSSLRPKHLLYPCQNLTDAQYLFKLQPIAKFDAQMIEDLGLSNVESLQNVKVDSAWGYCRGVKVCIQGLYQYGIFSTFFPGDEIPVWVSHKTKGSSISFTAGASSTNARIRGLNVCSVYACSGQRDTWNPPPLFTKIRNKSKRLNWIYGPHFYCMPEEGKEMIWLSHWKLGADLEVGDEVKVCVVVGDGFRVVECGIKLVYDDGDDDAQDSNAFASWTDVIGRDLTPQRWKGTCFLGSNHVRFVRGGGSTRVWDCTKTAWYSHLFEEPEEANDMKYWGHMIRKEIKLRKKLQISGFLET